MFDLPVLRVGVPVVIVISLFVLADYTLLYVQVMWKQDKSTLNTSYKSF